MADDENKDNKEVQVGATPTAAAAGVDYQPSADQAERREGQPDPKLTPGHPKYDQRAHMEAIIDEGRSVLHDGHVYSKKEQLPSAAQLAKGDPGKEKAALAALQAKQAELEAQIAELQGESKSAKDAKASKSEEAKP